MLKKLRIVDFQVAVPRVFAVSQNQIFFFCLFVNFVTFVTFVTLFCDSDTGTKVLAAAQSTRSTQLRTEVIKFRCLDMTDSHHELHRECQQEKRLLRSCFILRRCAVCDFRIRLYLRYEIGTQEMQQFHDCND